MLTVIVFLSIRKKKQLCVLFRFPCSWLLRRCSATSAICRSGFVLFRVAVLQDSWPAAHTLSCDKLQWCFVITLRASPGQSLLVPPPIMTSNDIWSSFPGGSDALITGPAGSMPGVVDPATVPEGNLWGDGSDALITGPAGSAPGVVDPATVPEGNLWGDGSDALITGTAHAMAQSMDSRQCRC